MQAPLPQGLYAALLGLTTSQCIFVFSATWAALLGLAWASPLPVDFKKQHADRLPSTFHALAASTCSVFAWVFVDTDCALPHFRAHWVRLAMLSTAGFLLVDVCSMLVVDVWHRWRRADPAVFFHHVLVIGCIIVSTETNCGLWFQLALLLNELAVVPLNFVQILRFFGLQHLLAYRLLMAFTGILWLLCRIVAIPLTLYRLKERGYCRAEWGLPISSTAVVACSVLWLMNLFWLWKLAKGAQRSRTEAQRSPKDCTSVACAVAGVAGAVAGDVALGSLGRHLAAMDSDPDTDGEPKGSVKSRSAKRWE